MPPTKRHKPDHNGECLCIFCSYETTYIYELILKDLFLVPCLPHETHLILWHNFVLKLLHTATEDEVISSLE